MKTTLTKSELDKLISDVQGQVDSYLATESQKLSKAKEESSPESPEGSPAAPTPEASGSDESAPPASAESTPAEGSDAPPAEATPSAEETAPAAPGQDPGADITTDPVALKGEYAKLDDAQLQAHYLAAREAVYERMSAGGGAAPAGDPSAPAGAPAPAGSPSASAPAPTPAPGPAAPAAAPAAPVATPSPAPADEPPPPAMKSESPEYTALQKKLEELEKNTKAEREMSMKAIDLLTRPMRKSLTGKDIVTTPAAKPLTKSEAIAKLNKLDPRSLKKSDQNAISAFCVGKLGIESIKHLLQDQK